MVDLLYYSLIVNTLEDRMKIELIANIPIIHLSKVVGRGRIH